ncbi:hypothetical protein RUND412_008407 [Rhizina undulata]
MPKTLTIVCPGLPVSSVPNKALCASNTQKSPLSHIPSRNSWRRRLLKSRIEFSRGSRCLGLKTRVFGATVHSLVVTYFRVYETTGVVYTDETENAAVDIGVRSLLDLREISDQLQAQLYEVQSLMEQHHTPLEDRAHVLGDWLAFLKQTMAPIVSIEPKEIVERGRP